LTWACHDIKSIETEKQDILQRRNWLVQNVMTTPQQLINAMPVEIGAQFQGEWALYSCSMLTKALSNIAQLYPETKNTSEAQADSLIHIVLSPQLRSYDADRWEEDALASLDGNVSHISYLSHLAWMIGNYKKICESNKYDALYDSICETMNRRILDSEIMNLPTYPNEPIYIPDMLVAIVALHDYAQSHHGEYAETVNVWIDKAKSDWIDPHTGMLASMLDGNGAIVADIKGSYSGLNCYYLSLIDDTFAREQYQQFKSIFTKSFPMFGVKEYTDKSPILALDIDAGILLFGLSPSGTAFAIGSATYFNDTSMRTKLLRTAEIVGHTVAWGNQRHYLLANVAPVGEAIVLAMRTNYHKIF
jgi:hypothetical protein